MSNLTPRPDKLERAVFGNEIEVAKINAPFTLITDESGNPRQINDLANNMKTSMGIERAMVNLVKSVDNEFGPNGESVYQPVNGDERIRFWGQWKNQMDSNGGYVLAQANGPTTSMEVTFYGTGLNILVNAIQLRVYTVNIDGGADFEPNPGFNGALTLSGRNFRQNQVLNVANGLALGVHTVRVRCDVDSSLINGIEVLNESANLVVNAGSPSYDTKNRQILAQQAISYNSDFDAGSDPLGTMGGRVLVYQNTDGTIAKKLKVAALEPQGSELLLNGTFDTDLSSWTDVSTGGSSAAWDAANGGSLLLTNSGVGGENPAITQDIATINGESYELQFDVPTGGTYSNVTEVRFEGSTTKTVTVNANSGKTKKIIFTADDTTTTIRLTSGSSLTSGTSYIDNVSIKVSESKFLGNTDHSNEEIIRRISWFEFGANRSDDFSTVTLGGATSNARAFTLDDGSTTLVVTNAETNAGTNGIKTDPSGYITITFIGTGLDITADFRAASVVWQHSFEVDGVEMGILSGTSDSTFASINRYSICSGLPYGTHTVKITRDTDHFNIYDFVIYGPKKPEIDDNLMELAEYNILGDYGFNTSTLPEGNSSGIIVKDCVRETIYTGAWTILQDSFDIRRGGANAETSGNGDFAEYTFWGTGIAYNFGCFNSHTSNSTLTIDGVLVNDANFGAENIDFKGTGNVSFDGSTGILNQNSGGTNGTGSLGVVNLPLGLHTVRITNNAAATITINGWDVITPTHINNTALKEGSLSLRDLRTEKVETTDNSVDLSKAKAWVVYNRNTQTVNSSYNIATVLHDNNNLYVYFKYPFKDRFSYGATMMVGDYEDASADVGQVSPTRIHKNYMELWLTQANNQNTTADFVSVFFFGELENEADIDFGDL